ncbi:calcium/sodium antiporter [Aeoliella sp. SH292]|uniref:calcium/sodium antiporter n=1 Tax=Aeoliella sp. SH292 TaxID=3454464 RepID=UPI003F9C709B
MWIALGIVGGFVALIAGGELLVRGASNLAAAAKVSPLVIGLTVVATGTSAPELAVSVKSCYAGNTDLAIGNAVGSNITNLLMILGLSAVAAPLAVNIRLFKIDIPAMIVAAVALWLIGLDGTFTRLEGIGCVAVIIAYFAFTVHQGRRESAIAAAELEKAEAEITYDQRTSGWTNILLDVLKLIVGLVLLVLGAEWLVKACVALALGFGVSELVVGLTVVAIGTSLPELVTSVMASLRGHRDLAVGNVVGSNVLNIFLVLGLSAVVAPAGINVAPQPMAFDIPFMIAISIAALPVFFSGLGITRVEGGAMLLYYVAYVAFLIWHAGQPAGTVTPTSHMLLFVAPLVPLTLLVVYFRPREAT